MAAKKLFVLQSFNQPYSNALYDNICQAVHSVSLDIEVLRADKLESAGSRRPIIQDIYDAIESSDFLICDLTDRNANVMYELGYAHALGKPAFLISQDLALIPFDLRRLRVFSYDARKPDDLVTVIKKLTENFLANPDAFASRPAAQAAPGKVFVSYCHSDLEFLKRLMIHLRPLEKGGLIDSWVDTKLQAGDRWREAIEEALLRARVAVLLITADFLASDFVVDSELPTLLGNAEAKGIRIIPVILKPCRYSRDPKLSRFQAINDPNTPLISLSEQEQENLYDRIAQAVERAMTA